MPLASSESTRVTSTLFCCASLGSASQAGVLLMAAQWTTSSGLSRRKAERSAGKSVSSSSARVRDRTHQSRGAARTMCEPMRPPAPVTHASGGISIDQSLRQIAVGIDASVAQKRPMGARDIHFAEVQGNEKVFLFVHTGFGDDLSRRAGNKALAPEFNAVATDGAFEANAIGDRDISAVGHAVTALDQFPGPVLRLAVLRFLAWVPSNGCRIENDLRALHRGQARGFGIPLVPADAYADARVFRAPGFEAKIARREIKLLVEKRIIRDMHLSVDA